jgi:hypothetical protein
MSKWLALPAFASALVLATAAVSSASADHRAGRGTALSRDAGPGTGHAQYRPIQSISYEFGSKFTSGYFVRQGAKCLVTLLVTEKSDNEKPSPLTAARIRLILKAGQIAGLESQEGQSLNFTCGEGATALLVDAGEKKQLAAAQKNTLPQDVAQSNLEDNR